jgi:hypothetical protein
MNKGTEATAFELLVANGQEVANQLRHLAENEIDSDSFAVVYENYNGRETEYERPITELAIQAAEQFDALIAALEGAQAQSSKWIEAYHKAVSIGARYEERIAELESSVIAPGIMRCAKCGFVLTKNSINMATGTITAGDSKTEPCPNSCGPLWPGTWKEQALDMRDSAEQWFEDLQAANRYIAELEASKLSVKLPAYRNSPDMHMKQYYEAIGFNQGLDACAEAFRAAGGSVEGSD